MRNAESVSALLFATARQVVADQGLLEPAPDLAERRQAFMDELRTILADIDRMGLVSTRQFRERETSARASGREASGPAIRWSRDSLRAGAPFGGVARAARGRPAGRMHRRRTGCAHCGCADGHGPAGPGAGHDVGPAAVRAAGEDRRRRRGGFVPVRGLLRPPQQNGVLDAPAIARCGPERRPPGCGRYARQCWFR